MASAMVIERGPISTGLKPKEMEMINQIGKYLLSFLDLISYIKYVYVLKQSRKHLMFTKAYISKLLTHRESI